MTNKLSREEVQHIALLARLGISDEELEKLREQLSNILKNMDILEEVDTEDVPPTAQPVALQNVFRNDEERSSFPSDEILKNSPSQENGFFRIHAVLE